MNKMVIFLYRLLGHLITLFLPIYLLIRKLKGKEIPGKMWEKLGCYKSKFNNDKPIIHIHAASVGESLSLMKLFKIIMEEGKYNVVFTTITKASYEMMHNKLPENIQHVFMPLDVNYSIKKFLNTFKPCMHIFCEAEIWPNFIISAKSPKFMVSAKISDKSFNRWKKKEKLAKYIFSHITHIYTQSDLDYNKFQQLSNNVTNNGNFKFDNEKLKLTHDFVKAFTMNLLTKKILVASSTHQGEEEIILNAYKEIKKIRNDIFLVLIPRHIIRTNVITYLIQKYEMTYALHSEVKGQVFNEDVYLVNTMGEMGNFYELADIVFVGGTFVKVGGHNIIEPAHFQKIIITGPHYHNNINIYEKFKQNKALLIVNNEEELFDKLLHIIKNEEEYSQYGNNALNLVNEFQKITLNVWEDIKKKIGN